MTPAQIHELIQQGEGLTLEFKQAQTKLNRDVYESICAFLNRSGGTLLLGVKDNRDIMGIDPAYLPQLKRDLVTTLHNLINFNSPVYPASQEIEVAGNILLVLQVPQSS